MFKIYINKFTIIHMFRKILYSPEYLNNIAFIDQSDKERTTKA